MNIPPEILEIAQRWVDDQTSLTDEDWLRLVESCRASPELVRLLHEQLQTEDRLSRLLAGDRQQFLRQVEQRVADYLRGDDELTRQAAELRALALARYQSLGKSTTPHSSAWWAWGLTLSLVLLVAAGSGAWLYRETTAITLQVAAVQGNVVVQRAQANDRNATPHLVLQGGDRLLVQHDAQVTLHYPDGTEVVLAGESILDLPDTLFNGKQLYLDRGQLTAQVAPQPANRPMIFTTPHAEAIVRGTELELIVRDRETQLNVAEGKVELAERKTHDSQMVQTAESAVAVVGEKIVKQGISFPTQRHGLLYLFAGRQQPVLTKINGTLRPTELKASGTDAHYTSIGNLELAGGSFSDEQVSPLLKAIHASGEYTFELILSPDVVDHDVPQIVLAFGSPQHPTWTLLQRRETLYWLPGLPNVDLEQWLTEESRWQELARFPAAQSTMHLLVSYRKDRLLIAKEGVTISSHAAPELLHIATSSVSGTEPAQLCFGIVPGLSTAAWRGRIAGFALYERALPESDWKRAQPK
jgi:FecR protein